METTAAANKKTGQGKLLFSVWQTEAAAWQRVSLSPSLSLCVRECMCVCLCPCKWALFVCIANQSFWMIDRNVWYAVSSCLCPSPCLPYITDEISGNSFKSFPLFVYFKFKTPTLTCALNAFDFIDCTKPDLMAQSDGNTLSQSLSLSIFMYMLGLRVTPQTHMWHVLRNRLIAWGGRDWKNIFDIRNVRANARDKF